VETVYGTKTVKAYEAMADRCLSCKSKKHVVYDELIGEEGDVVADCNRFDTVAKLEAMTPEERFAFWRGELSRCIRCNACRNVCPACTCEQCVFDNPNSGVAQKAAATSFEENMFHIIRAFHVAGRCTDCGECSRVCPQHIPLHLLNRKFIKDMNEFYGEYQAGAEVGSRAPLVNYTTEDLEPGEVFDRRDTDA
jgi:ferredoxin